MFMNFVVGLTPAVAVYCRDRGSSGSGNGSVCKNKKSGHTTGYSVPKTGNILSANPRDGESLPLTPLKSSAMKKFAVVLAGCGVYDGAEIHEAVMTLYAILKNGASYEIFAPDIPQHHVINHLNGAETAESRNVLVESARIARGKISPLSELDMRAFDMLIFPGGFGVAKNLCDFAFKGENCTVIPEVAALVRDAVSLRKPVGALCIAPVILARLLGDVKLTIGHDEPTAVALSRMGAHHELATHGQVIYDPKYKVFSTPCYMLDANLLQIAEGAAAIVQAMLLEK
jgi:enhancing lycopene biosynthesis protein 2